VTFPNNLRNIINVSVDTFGVSMQLLSTVDLLFVMDDKTV